MAEGQIKRSINPELNQISGATLGRDVRDSIVQALTKIATTFDSQMSSYASAVNGAQQAASTYTTNAQTIQLSLDKANTIDEKVERLNTALGVLTDPGPSVEYSDYSRDASTGIWSPGNTEITYDAVTDPEHPRFVFTFPKGPLFSSLTFAITTDPDGTPAIDYDPSTGSLSLSIPDVFQKKLNAMTFNYKTLSPGDDGYDIPTTPGGAIQNEAASYNPLTNTLTLKLRKGDTGTGVEGMVSSLNKRPFFMRDLYVTDPSIFLVNATTPNYFPQQSRVDRERTVDQESGKIIFNGANDFDAAIIVFRKSVDNNSGVQLNNNFSWNKTKTKDITNQKNAAFLANNIDYDSTVSVFIRKPAYDPNNNSSERMTTATACFIDAAGRRFTRRVHWTAVDCHLVCQGGAKKTWPLIRIIPDVDNNADAQTGVGTYGTRVGDAFTGAFIFENAKQDGSGDGPEWSWHALNTYQQTLLSKSDKNPQQMINLNKVYNQVLIPERIIGISFGAPSELVDLYTGPRYTDTQD